MLKRAKISHFKSLADVDLTFGQENIIVGPNGSGKSNLIDAIYLVKDAVVDDLDTAITKRHGIDSIRRWSKTRPYNISIELHFDDGKLSNGYYKFVLSSANRGFAIVEEEAEWSTPSPFDENRQIITNSFKRNSRGSIEYKIEKNPFGPIPDIKLPSTDLALQKITSAYLSFFFAGLHNEISSFSKYSIYPNEIREPQTISAEEVLRDTGSNLTAVIKKMSGGNRKNRERLLDALQLVLPILKEVRIESAGGFYVPVFRVQEPNQPHAHELNMSQISDGTLRLVGLLVAFYQNSAPLRIAVEEPEQMIHPGLLQILMDAARDYLANSNNRQIFLTTHSPTLLDMFDANDIIQVNFEDGISKCSKVSDRQRKIISDRLFSAGELLVAEGLF